MPVRLRPEEKERFRRIEELLRALRVFTELRATVLLALTDERTPSPYSPPRAAGLPIAAGAGTNKLFRYAAERLGADQIDREQRDYVFPQLGEVGIVEPALILTATRARERGAYVERGRHEPKSPNNAYVVTEEVWKLLLETSAKQWPRALARWLAEDKQRRVRTAEAKAAKSVASVKTAETKHARLIRACVDVLLESIARDYELVYIDDSDGDRVRDEFKEPLREAGLEPDLESKWPDAILIHRTGRRVHFIDAVTTDGEFDESRARAIIEWARKRGWSTEGLTTAYETWSRAAGRQAAHRNLAIGSYLWIAEDGGKLFKVESLGGG